MSEQENLKPESSLPAENKPVGNEVPKIQETPITKLAAPQEKPAEAEAIAPSPSPKPAPKKEVPVDDGSVLKKSITQRGVTEVEEGKVNRRSFIKILAIGWVAFAGIVAGYGTLIMRYLFPNVLFEPKQSFGAGHINDYTVGEVSERYKQKQGVWIVRDSEKIYALSTTCTHLGCTPNWLSNESKFKCPCHGSGFYKTGINFEGPAPRPLERFKIYLSSDGEVIVDKTKKFQQEKGEWSDPSSYILA